MVVKLSNIIKYIILFLIILNTKIFMFGDYESILRYIDVLGTIILFLLVINYKKAYKIVSKYKFQRNWIYTLIFALVINGINAVINHGVSITFVIAQIYSYVIILLLFPLIYIVESGEKNYNWLVNKIVSWGIIATLIRIIVWYLYNFLGIDIMHYLLYEAGYDWIRNGRQRIPIPCFDCVIFAYGLSTILSNNKIKDKIKGAIYVGFVLFYSYFVVDSRAMVLVLLISSLGMYLYQRKKSSNRILRFIVLFIIGIGILAGTGIVSKYISSIDSWSIVARQQAISYYFEQFKKNVVFGINLIQESTDLQRGPGGNFYFADLGTLSKFVEYGLFVGILFILPLIRMAYISFKIKTDSKEKMFLVGLTIYIIISCILSQDIYFSRNIFIFPFVICIVEYSFRRSKSA